MGYGWPGLGSIHVVTLSMGVLYKKCIDNFCIRLLATTIFSCPHGYVAIPNGLPFNSQRPFKHLLVPRKYLRFYVFHISLGFVDKCSNCIGSRLFFIGISNGRMKRLLDYAVGLAALFFLHLAAFQNIYFFRYFEGNIFCAFVALFFRGSRSPLLSPIPSHSLFDVINRRIIRNSDCHGIIYLHNFITRAPCFASTFL